MQKMQQYFKNMALMQAMPLILVVVGIVGLFASFILTSDTFNLMQHPDTKVGCDLNPIVSCGTVIGSSGSTLLLNIPNPVFGIAAFSVLTTLGVLALSGVKFKRWIWLGLQAGVTGGVILVHYFFYDTMYIAKAICPYCMATDTSVIVLFWYTTLYNIQQKNIILPARLQKIGDFARRHHLDILLIWLMVVAATILSHFWYYFGKHLPF